MIPVDLFQHNQYVVYFNTEDMISEYEAFTNHKIDMFYLDEITVTEWAQMIDEHRDK